MRWEWWGESAIVGCFLSFLIFLFNIFLGYFFNNYIIFSFCFLITECRWLSQCHKKVKVGWYESHVLLRSPCVSFFIFLNHLCFLFLLFLENYSYIIILNQFLEITNHIYKLVIFKSTPFNLFFHKHFFFNSHKLLCLVFLFIYYKLKDFIQVEV